MISSSTSEKEGSVTCPRFKVKTLEPRDNACLTCDLKDGLGILLRQQHQAETAQLLDNNYNETSQWQNGMIVE